MRAAKEKPVVLGRPWSVTECNYGDFTYLYSGLPGVGGGRSRRSECHGSVGIPKEHHHCRLCGGYYCLAHTGPGSHDCGNIVNPHGAASNGPR